MKLGKKKTPESSVKDSGEKKNGNGGKDPAKAASLTSTWAGQAVVVLLVGILTAALVQWLVIRPLAGDVAASRLQAQARAAVARVTQRIDLLHQTVKGYAESPMVAAAVNDPARRREMDRILADAIPGAQQVFLFPRGHIQQTTPEGVRLSFASMDLARRAEQGQAAAPDAFARGGHWFVQFAAPVKDPKSKAVVGTLLAVFDTGILRPALKVTDPELSGQLALIQQIDGNREVLVSAGTGTGARIDSPVPDSSWALGFRPARSPSLPANTTMLWALSVGVALLGAVLVIVLFMGLQRRLRADMMSLTHWAQIAFAGERVRLPRFGLALIGALGESLQRLAQVADKRGARAAATTQAGRPAAAPKDATPGPEAAADEPLFQNKDILGMDMLADDEDVLGLGSSGGEGDVPEVSEAPPIRVEVSPAIFRAYDIRGVVGENLTPEVVELIGRALGSEARSRGQQALCVGFDGRHSSPELADAAARGILSTGCDVIEVGRVPTPVLYFATYHLQTRSGVMITGSHNPANYNGLKMVLGEHTLASEDIQKLLRRIQTGDFEKGQGSRRREDVRSAYLERIVDDIAVAAPLKVVLDAGNGVAGELAPRLVEELGCEVIPLHCDIDGDFPNHHPDPGKPENLQDLIDRVRSEGADLGLAFDGDGDRLGVVTNTGKIIWPDRLLMLLARDVVSRNPGADIIYDVKCSRRLAGVINEYGGRPVMWKTGHSLIKARMRETGALLAGEMSGHIFFAERWYGFDDALYSAARLLEILGVEDRTSDEVFSEFPEDVSTPELNVEVSDEDKFRLVEQLAGQGQFGEASISTIDGVRVDYPDGWGLCRASNTTPVLVLRFEAESDAALARIQAVFREQLHRIRPELQLGF